MFKKSQRITNQEFSHFFKAGKRLHSDSFEIRFTKHPTLKVAVVVPKKVSKSSVARNKLRRKINHHLKNILTDTTGAYIVITKKSIDQTFSAPVKEELQSLVGQL